MSGVVCQFTWIRNGKVIPIFQIYRDGCFYICPILEGTETCESK